MTRRRVVATGVVLLTASVLAAGGWWVDAHLDDRRQLAVVRAEAHVAIGEVAALDARGAAVQRRLTIVAGDLAATSAAVATTELAQGAALADEVELVSNGAVVAAELEAAFIRLGGVLDTLATARRTLDVHGAEVMALATCLDGISRAADALAVDDGARAVTEMATVAGPCGAAEQAVTGATGDAPVLPFDFADPYVVEHDGTYYGYATNGGGGHIQLVRSGDLATWEWLGNALPVLPSWAGANRTWAPSVLRRGSTWVLYYAVLEVASGDQCISTATAANPAGPFVDASSGPFLCQRDEGGSIDPSPFLDAAGEPWLVWKGEGETAGASATLWSQRLSPDGRQLVGEPSRLLHADQRWERRTIEGPSMVAGPGGYHLFYSAGAWSSAGYGVGHARCASPAGPCTKSGDGRLLSSSGAIAGPGGQEVLRDGAGRLHLVFHAWTASDVGYPNKRSLHVADLAFAGDVPVISR